MNNLSDEMINHDYIDRYAHSGITMSNLSDEMINRLRKLANKTTIYDEYDENETVELDSAFGGNIDDAYSGGQEDGEIYLAREILTALNIDWVKSA